MDTRFFQTQAHDYFLRAVNALGKQIDREGMCYGYVVSAARAYRKGKLEHFDNTISLLYETVFKVLSNEENQDATEEEFNEKFRRAFSELDEKSQKDIHRLTEKIARIHTEQIEKKPFKEEQVFETTGIYDELELVNYLNSLQEKLREAQKENQGVTLVLKGKYHTIFLAVESNRILLRDINKPDLIELNNVKEIFSCINIRGADNEYLFLDTEILAPKSDPTLISLIEEWKNSELMQSLHQLTPEKIALVSGDGSSLLESAVKKNKLDAIKEFFELQPDLAKMSQAPKALFFSIVYERKEIFDYLLQQDIDINFVVYDPIRDYAISSIELAIQLNEEKAALAMLAKQQADSNKISSISPEVYLEKAKERDCVEELNDFFEEYYGVSLYDTDKKIDLPLFYLATMMGNTQILSELLKNQETVIFNPKYTISADELALIMKNDEVSTLILNHYKSNLRERLQKLDITENHKHVLVYHFIEKTMDDPETSVRTLYQFENEFLKFHELEKKLMALNNENIYHDFSLICEEYVDMNFDYSLMEMKNLENKLAWLEEINSMDDNSDTLKSAAVRKMKSLLLSNLSFEEIDEAYQVFHNIVKLEKLIGLQKSSSYCNKIDPKWYDLLNQYYQHFQETSSIQDSQIKKITDNILGHSFIGAILLRPPIKEYFNITTTSSQTNSTKLKS